MKEERNSLCLSYPLSTPIHSSHCFTWPFWYTSSLYYSPDKIIRVPLAFSKRSTPYHGMPTATVLSLHLPTFCALSMCQLNRTTWHSLHAPLLAFCLGCSSLAQAPWLTLSHHQGFALEDLLEVFSDTLPIWTTCLCLPWNTFYESIQ